MTSLCLVVPCYNEEEIIVWSAEKLVAKMQKLIEQNKISTESKILLVNDGSKDSTWKLIRELCSKEKMIKAISFSRNYGHQNAVLAGLMETLNNFPEIDVTISIDADLQQDIDAIDEFLEKYQDDCQIVYGVRNNRNTDGFLKKTTALMFYKLMLWLGCKTIKNHADYRLISRKALIELEKYNEVNLFLRGLIPTLGYKTGIVYFDVHEREAGSSKYNLSKMLTLAIDGITSFSVKPMRIICCIGIVSLIISFLQMLNLLVSYFNGVDTIRGWASTICLIWFFGGMILFSLGIIGEYIGKMYLETKHRPRYIIEHRIYKETVDVAKGSLEEKM